MLTPRAADLDTLDYLAEERAAREASPPVCCLCGRERHVTIELPGTTERTCSDCIGGEVAFRLAARRVSIAATVELYTRQVAETRTIARSA